MNKKQIGITVVAVIVLTATVAFAQNIYNIYDSVVNTGDTTNEAADVSFGTGAVIGGPWVDQSGLVTYVMSGSFTDATTTFVSVLNPFYSPTSTTNVGAYKPPAAWATSTVDLVTLNVTGGATTTMQVICGADNDGYDADGTLAYELLHGVLTGTTTGILENDMDNTKTPLNFGTASTSKILMDATAPYFICYATGTSYSASTWWQSTNGTTDASAMGINAEAKGIMGANNNFDGTYKIRFYRSQY